jgi:hypothetical protein
MSIPNDYTQVGEHHHHAPRLTRRTLFSTLIPGAILASHGFPQNSVSMAERFATYGNFACCYELALAETTESTTISDRVLLTIVFSSVCSSAGTANFSNVC